MWLFFYHLWEKLLNLKTKYKKDENAEKCFLFRQLDWWETVHAYSVEYFSGKYPKIRRFTGKQLPRSLFLYLKENFKEGIYLWNLRYFLEYFFFAGPLLVGAFDWTCLLMLFLLCVSSQQPDLIHMSHGCHGDLTLNVKQVSHIVLLFLLSCLTNITCSNSTMKVTRDKC